MARGSQRFGSIRTGRASPIFVEKLRIDYYGSEVPLQQLAGFSVPEPRLLVISPYDKAAIKAFLESLTSETTFGAAKPELPPQ